MSAWPPQINDWQELGLDWTYLDESKYYRVNIPAEGQVQLPIDQYTFKYPEGVLIEFSALFEHPNCGWRLEMNPELDTGDVFTVTNIALGLTAPEVLSYARLPPDMPAGLYLIRIPGPWFFKDWMRMYLINSDTSDHRAIGHAYHLAVLKEPRPEINADMKSDLALLMEAYPEKKRYIMDQVKLKLKKKLEAKQLDLNDL